MALANIIPDRFRRTIALPPAPVARAEEVSKDDAQRIFDEQAQRYLNMSGDDFLRAWDAGEFTDPDTPEIMRVAMLIPFGRQ